MKHQKIIVILVAVVAIGTAVAGLWIHNRHVNNTKAHSVNTTQSTPNAPIKGPTSSGTAPTTGTSTPNSTSDNQQGDGPIAPAGSTFVSDHNRQLSNSKLSSEQSVCNTSPGASCVIEFSQNGVTKSLPAKTTDSYGTAYWSWTLQEIGLTPGSWQITAKATLNGQTKTAQDATNLNVQP